MRIATSSWYTSQSADLLDLQARAARTQQQIATGKRLVSAADDPLAAQRSDRYRRAGDELAQADRNADTLQRRLEASSQALDAMSNVMVRVRELALVASNDTLSVSDRAAVRIEVDELRDTMLELANTRDADGTHVFAGASVGTPAFGPDATGRVVWTGRGEPHEVPLGPQQKIRSGDAGKALLASPSATDAEASVFDLLDTFSGLLAPPAGGGAETEAERTARHTGLDEVLVRVKSNAGTITDTQAGQGARLARVDAERDRLNALGVEWQVAATALVGSDITASVVELERTLTVLRAVQASFGRVAALSLFGSL